MLRSSPRTSELFWELGEILIQFAGPFGDTLRLAQRPLSARPASVAVIELFPLPTLAMHWWNEGAGGLTASRLETVLANLWVAALNYLHEGADGKACAPVRGSSFRELR